MKNVLLILALLFGGFVLARILGFPPGESGRIGIALVFLFTAVGHFAMTGAMADMLPAFVPARRALILASGVLEVAVAATLPIPVTAPAAGVVAGAFLVLVTPANISAARRRVSFGGHGAGPRYLWVRLPLQLLLIVWVCWFAIGRIP